MGWSPLDILLGNKTNRNRSLNSFFQGQPFSCQDLRKDLVPEASAGGLVLQCHRLTCEVPWNPCVLCVGGIGTQALRWSASWFTHTERSKWERQSSSQSQEISGRGQGSGRPFQGGGGSSVDSEENHFLAPSRSLKGGGQEAQRRWTRNCQHSLPQGWC